MDQILELLENTSLNVEGLLSLIERLSPQGFDLARTRMLLTRISPLLAHSASTVRQAAAATMQHITTCVKTAAPTRGAVSPALILVLKIVVDVWPAGTGEAVWRAQEGILILYEQVIGELANESLAAAIAGRDSSELPGRSPPTRPLRQPASTDQWTTPMLQLVNTIMSQVLSVFDDGTFEVRRIGRQLLVTFARFLCSLDDPACYLAAFLRNGSGNRPGPRQCRAPCALLLSVTAQAQEFAESWHQAGTSKPWLLRLVTDCRWGASHEGIGDSEQLAEHRRAIESATQCRSLALCWRVRHLRASVAAILPVVLRALSGARLRNRIFAKTLAVFLIRARAFVSGTAVGIDRDATLRSAVSTFSQGELQAVGGAIEAASLGYDHEVVFNVLHCPIDDDRMRCHLIPWN